MFVHSRRSSELSHSELDVMIPPIPNLSNDPCETGVAAVEPYGLALLDAGLFETVRQSLRSVTRLSSC